MKLFRHEEAPLSPPTFEECFPPQEVQEAHRSKCTERYRTNPPPQSPTPADYKNMIPKPEVQALHIAKATARYDRDKELGILFKEPKD